MIRRICVTAALLAAGAIIGWAGSAGGTAKPAQAPARAPAFPDGRLIDLSHPFNEQAIYWPTAATFKLEKVAEGETEQGYFYAANNFSAAEHGGTHLDAPVHFARGGDTADKIPLRRLVGRGTVVDVTEASAGRSRLPGRRLGPAGARAPARPHRSRRDRAAADGLRAVLARSRALHGHRGAG